MRETHKKEQANGATTSELVKSGFCNWILQTLAEDFSEFGTFLKYFSHMDTNAK